MDVIIEKWGVLQGSGPNFIRAHPPSPENTLLGVGGV